jgi:transposase-like protein
VLCSRESPFANCLSGAPGGDYLSRAIVDCRGAPTADTAFMGLTSCRWITIAGTLTRRRRAAQREWCPDNSLPIAQVAREFGVSGTTPAFWVKAYRQQLARRPLRDLSDQERIRELERRNRELETENALLKSGRVGMY